ncbi:exosortase-dependent surface protein XDP2 [Anabaena sp. CCY 0017]|uniref:exosortase-dependent surface protein XDP2 n=1 Tax=Anabaena sp. CCY 0017 TaxID=3103866 RepID=UPI0039C67158
MKLQKISTLTGLMAAGVLALSSAPAQAFSFTTNFTQTGGSKGDTTLNSVEKDGQIIDKFIFVNRADILENDIAIPANPNSGGASADRGDNATGIVVPNPSDADIVTALGNNNLNSIIDGEDGNVADSGSFKMNLFFKKAVDHLFFWERGQNSDLNVQAIDKDGNLLGSLLKILRGEWDNAGYSIDTTEIPGAQSVGSRGVSLADLGLDIKHIYGIQVSAFADQGFNGPDFKVVGAKTVPEPASLLGLGLVAGVVGLSRRRQGTKNA